MKTYLITKIFGVVIGVAGPLPYTHDQCIESLSTLKNIPELETEYSCVQADSVPSHGVLTIDQIKKVDQFGKRYADKNP